MQEKQDNRQLQTNIDQLQQAIKGFALDTKQSNTTTDCLDTIKFDQTTFLGLKTAASHQPDFYSNAIEKLSEAADIEAGVQWTIDKTNNTLIRDARSATGLAQNSIYSQLATAFNSARAADRMIRMTDGVIRDDSKLNDSEKTRIQEIKDKLEKVTKNVKTNPEQSIDLKSLNGFLVGVLKQDERYSKDKDEKLLKQLNTTKDLAGLEDKKYNVCTIYNQLDSTGETRTVFEADAMIPPLADNYEGLKQDVIDANNKKSPFNGNMINAYWGALAAQETIPTQNLKTLPGLRNAYVKQVGEIKADKSIDVFGQTIHTGTVSSGLETKQENQIANANVRHMSAISKSLGNEQLIITSLNTPVLGVESQAWSQLEKGVKKDTNVQSALTPMNSFRRLVSPQVKSYDDSLKKLGNDLKAAHPEVGKYLAGDWFASESNAKKSLAKIEDPKVKQTLELAIKTKSAVNEGMLGSFMRWCKSFFVTVEDHGMSRSLRQTGGMTALTSLVNKGALGKDIKMPAMSVHCKSGKDRTGATSIDSTRRMIEANIGQNAQNLEKQINAGHVGKMAEIGGTPGSVGMKPHCGLNGQIYTKDLLDKVGLKTAKNNKIEESSKGNIVGEISQDIPKVQIKMSKAENSIDPEIAQAATAILQNLESPATEKQSTKVEKLEEKKGKSPSLSL